MFVFQYSDPHHPHQSLASPSVRPSQHQQHVYMRSQIFLFILRMALFVSTGLALHSTQTSTVIAHCPGLWETMLIVLVIKCIRMAICPALIKLVGNGGVKELWCLVLANLLLDTAIFVTECTITSVSLNSKECVFAAGIAPFGVINGGEGIMGGQTKGGGVSLQSPVSIATTIVTRTTINAAERDQVLLLGIPTIAHVNLIACVWDGSYILAHVLYLMLQI